LKLLISHGFNPCEYEGRNKKSLPGKSLSTNVISWFPHLLFEFNLYRYITASASAERMSGRSSAVESEKKHAAQFRGIEAGRYTLTPPDSQLKGAWY
jgi:hypothetical protein